MKHSPGFEKLVTAVRQRISEISIEKYIEKRDSSEAFVLIDVREDNEWSNGCIDKAIHMGRGIIERDIEKRFPDPNICLILYCGGGYRSALAADSLKQMGYNNIYSLQGGFRAWTDKNLPITQT